MEGKMQSQKLTKYTFKLGAPYEIFGEFIYEDSAISIDFETAKKIMNKNYGVFMRNAELVSVEEIELFGHIRPAYNFSDIRKIKQGRKSYSSQ